MSAPEDRTEGASGDSDPETDRLDEVTEETSGGADPTDEGEAEFDEEEVHGDDAAESSVPEEPPADPLELAQAEASRLRDQLLRTAADFDNYRKRSRRDVEDAERRGREELLRELLPVFDNLERASAHAEKAADVQSLADGLAMVLKQFIDTLGKAGIERVEALGCPFDPAVHEAIQQIETDEFEPGMVANEFQAGYRLGERLVRPAMVVVAKKPSSGD